MNLTTRNVESLAAKAKRSCVWDDTVKGFGVRVEPTGRKAVLCQYRAASS